MGLEEKVPSGILLTSVERLAGWARAGSVWPATFGLACCGIELIMTVGPRHDLARFGMELARNTPRQADLMIVAGRVRMLIKDGAPIGRAERRWGGSDVCASSDPPTPPPACT